MFQLSGDAAGSHPVSGLVDKNKSAFPTGIPKPLEGFPLQCDGNIDSAELAAFGIQIQVPDLYMFDFDLEEFTDARAGGSEKSYNKIVV